MGVLLGRLGDHGIRALRRCAVPGSADALGRLAVLPFSRRSDGAPAPSTGHGHSQLRCAVALWLLAAALGGNLAAQEDAPTVANPGFEEGMADWEVRNGAEFVAVEEGAGRDGGRGIVFRSNANELLVRQEFHDVPRRPMIVTAHARADNLEITKGGENEDYARLYVHVLYRDRPYSDASHFYTDVPPGSYEWRRFGVEIRPRHDLEPAEMWVSLAGRFGAGTLYWDDVALSAVKPFAGADSATWERSADATVISDLSACTPAKALADRRTRGRWKVLEYETAAFSGKCIAAGPETGAPPVTLPLDVSGWHAIYLGMGGHSGASSVVKAKVSGDAAYQMRAHSTGHVQEVFLKCADLTGRDLHFAQQSAGHAIPCVLMYVKLVPMSEDEVAAVTRDASQHDTKRLVATIDGFSFLYDRRPTTREELLEEFEHYRGTDFGTIWWCVSGADQVNYDSKLGTINGQYVDDFAREGDRRYTEAVKTLIRKGINISEVAVEAAHSMDAKIHVSIRPAAWQAPPPWEDFFTSDFYQAHPEWRCCDRDGTPVLRMSLAVPEVRQHLLGIFREVLQAGPDGLNVLYNRGMPIVLWEDAFCDLFRQRYGEDAGEVDEDDQRILDMRAEILTGFMREIRALLDETQEARGGEPLELSAMVLETEADNRRFGLDVEGWVKEGLIDAIGVYRGSSHASGKPIDMEYFTRMTEGTDVPVYPCMVAWALPPADEMLEKAVGYYDAGADGVLFWDPGATSRNGVLWPMVSRMGHIEELQLRADLGAPPATTLKLTRFDNHVYGRWTPMAGF